MKYVSLTGEKALCLSDGKERKRHKRGAFSHFLKTYYDPFIDRICNVQCSVVKINEVAVLNMKYVGLTGE